MALLPYLLDYEIRPRHRRNRIFDMDILDDLMDRPLQLNQYLRPWRKISSALQDVGSTIKSDKDKFQINLDVQHFAPDEIAVKTADNFVIIEGKHEEKQDEHGYISRQFKRRYALPEGCKPESVESRLSADGVLSIVAPKKTVAGERAVPITHTGPVRRKHADEQLEDHQGKENGEMEVEVTPQQKKKKRN